MLKCFFLFITFYSSNRNSKIATNKQRTTTTRDALWEDFSTISGDTGSSALQTN